MEYHQLACEKDHWAVGPLAARLPAAGFFRFESRLEAFARANAAVFAQLDSGDVTRCRPTAGWEQYAAWQGYFGPGNPLTVKIERSVEISLKVYLANPLPLSFKI